MYVVVLKTRLDEMSTNALLSSFHSRTSFALKLLTEGDEASERFRIKQVIGAAAQEARPLQDLIPVRGENHKQKHFSRRLVCGLLLPSPLACKPFLPRAQQDTHRTNRPTDDKTSVE